MQTRIMTAVIALMFFIPIIVIGGLCLEVLATIIAGIGVFELFRMHNLEIKSLEGVLSILGSVVLVFPLAKYLPFLSEQQGNWTFFSLIVLILLGISVISKNLYSIDEAAFPVIASLYLGIGFNNFLLARSSGLPVIFFALILIWVTDSCAYFVGRKYGKNLLFPEISPKKTIEGAIGGLAGALFTSLIFVFIFPAVDHFNHYSLTMIMMSVILSAVGQFGDLVESAIKRHFSVKDSGNLLPGHGGILDRFDSLLFVLPVMHFLGIF